MIINAVVSGVEAAETIPMLSWLVPVHNPTDFEWDDIDIVELWITPKWVRHLFAQGHRTTQWALALHDPTSRLHPTQSVRFVLWDASEHPPRNIFSS